MHTDIRVPEAGESITQVELARWLVEDGSFVEKDQEIAEIDSDKATLTINAESSGIIQLMVEEGSTVEPGKIIGRIDGDAERPAGSPAVEPAKPAEADGQPGQGKTTSAGSPVSGQPQAGQGTPAGEGTAPGSGQPGSGQGTPTGSGQPGSGQDTPGAGPAGSQEPDVIFSPQAKRLLEEEGITADRDVLARDGKRITRRDILQALAVQLAEREGGQAAGAKAKGGPAVPPAVVPDPGSGFTGSWGGSRQLNRQKMSTLRKKVAERLVAVKNQTAMLTTFNEVDMSAIMALRKKYQKVFTEQYGFKLGFMSFFVKAVAESIPFFPQVNGQIDGNQIVLPDYADIGIAVSTPKGLMVPVIRNAEQQSLPELERIINELAERARDNKITIEELSGGTFSITNGGVFGSLLSTPIINPPQSAILGMHNIVERPVAIDGKVEIRPMMYLALSYDHRIVDGKESVSFLVKVKELIEDPVKLMFQGRDPMQSLLGL